MNDLESKTKKQLIEIIQTLSEKLKEVQSLEKQLVPKEEDLKGLALSIYEDSSGKFHKVMLKYDLVNGGCKIDKVTSLSTGDYQVAMYQAKKELVESIMNKKQTKVFKGENK